MSDISLPQVLSENKTASTYLLLLHISKDADCFDGHFEQYPIVPGVIQVDWAIQYATSRFSIQNCFSGMQRLKFQHPIEPDIQVTLEITYNDQTNVLSFVYKNDEYIFSNGLILFKA